MFDKKVTKTNPLYSKWCSMKQRCNNPKDRSYKNYGGRGIKIEWVSFEDFKETMQASYQAHIADFGKRNTSIERIDNDGNYSKENCKWATQSEQNLNKRDNLIVSFMGAEKTLKEWTLDLGLNYETALKRLQRGWTTDEVFKNPARKTPTVKFLGAVFTITELAQRFNVERSFLHKRIFVYGMKPYQAIFGDKYRTRV